MSSMWSLICFTGLTRGEKILSLQKACDCCIKQSCVLQLFILNHTYLLHRHQLGSTPDPHVIMAPSQWDPENDKDLLLLLLGFDVEISRTRFDEVAVKMTNGVSRNACR